MPRLRRLRPSDGYPALLKFLAERARDRCGFYDRDIYQQRMAATRAADDYWRRLDRAARKTPRDF